MTVYIAQGATNDPTTGIRMTIPCPRCGQVYRIRCESLRQVIDDLTGGRECRCGATLLDGTTDEDGPTEQPPIGAEPSSGYVSRAHHCAKPTDGRNGDVWRCECGDEYTSFLGMWLPRPRPAEVAPAEPTGPKPPTARDAWNALVEGLPHHPTRVASRLEVGALVMDALRAMCTESDPDAGPPVITQATMLGVPLFGTDARGPRGWAFLDFVGNVLSEGVIAPAEPTGDTTREAPDA